MERLLAWYALTSSVGAVVALVVANAIPLVGVLFLGWSVWTILIIYWVENGIVGFFNVLKMLKAEGGTGPGGTDPAAPAATPAATPAPKETYGNTGWLINSRPATNLAKVALVPFFIVHYGIFWLVHGLFVLALPLFAGMAGSMDGRLASSPAPDPRGILLAAIVLFVSHGASYLLNFIGAGEYRHVTAAGQMFEPYGRLLILHVTIIFGALAISLTGAPVVAVAILVVLKTALDLGFHLRQHRAIAGAFAAATAH